LHSLFSPFKLSKAQLGQGQFILWRAGKEAGTFALPAYSTHGQSTFWRVTLTPLAVTADAVVDATVAAVLICLAAARAAL
jgi:hypothetical protein